MINPDSRHPEPVTDLFVGGPADGFEQALEAGIEPHAVEPISGESYVRAPDRDTPTHRVWVHVEKPEHMTKLSIRRYQQFKGVTLDQLYHFVMKALRDGHHPEAVPQVYTTWGGEIKEIWVDSDTPGPTAKK